MVVSIGSNISSLIAQRRLSETTEAQSNISSKLSSGLRINKASDDAAGLAIADSLRANSRVFAQGIRNVNDGLSALNIAQGALSQLSLLATRQMELAEQSANGVYSTAQRRALNLEADALSKEFNRIVASATFNGRQILNGDYRGVRLQLGYGIDGSILTDIGSKLGRDVGTGIFQSGTTGTTGSNVEMMASGDLNGDGIDDIVAATVAGVSVMLSQGNGTFSTSNIAWQSNNRDVKIGDLNGDGHLDVVVGSSASRVGIFLNNGTGSISLSQELTTTDEVWGIGLGDYNGDGRLDIISTDRNNLTSMSLFFNNGNGTFGARTSLGVPSTNNRYGIGTGDLNGDGRDDFIFGNLGQAFVMLSNGDGTFRVASSFNNSESAYFQTADLNNDGFLDFVSGGSGSGSETVAVYLGNGDGTFRHTQSIDTVGTRVVLGDLNGDGYADIVTGSGGQTISINLSNGDGTFRATSTTTSASSQSFAVALGDFNGDGVLDLGSGGNSTTVSAQNAVTEKNYGISVMSLMTIEESLEALEVSRATLTRVTSELGAIGALQSRLFTAMNTLSVTRENSLAAESRIRDADIAQEAGEQLRLNILQQVGASVLAQANTLPSLALSLLRGGSSKVN